ncbi:MAG: fructose-bisphosphate aldolase [Ardenticatenia bacterium]|nr:MAG: fructose-bisphosphate aldolase [Ardenticatenia bacterium]
MHVNTAVLLQLAYGEYAVGAFSVNSIEQILGAMRGATEAAAPLIIQVSHQARRYAMPGVLEAAVHAAARHFPELVFALHLDHGDEAACYEGIDSGLYGSVMIDASAQPLAENIAITRRVVERAHARGVAVEAELGRLGGKEDDLVVAEDAAWLTDPDAAAEFVARSGCDALAVAVGTRHGIHKFAASGQLDLERLAAIRARLPGVPLVLHGASSVPAAEVARINAAGGAVAADAHGVPEALYPELARRGVAKINIDTDGRLVWARVLREYLRDHPATLDLREPGRVFMAAYAERVAQLCRCFGAAGRLAEVRRRLGV